MEEIHKIKVEDRECAAKIISYIKKLVSIQKGKLKQIKYNVVYL